jgi:hypothetical protein
MKTNILIITISLFALTASGHTKKEVFSIENYGINNSGTALTIQFEKGPEHNHPLFAI